jgi:hypothetical protein
MQENIMTKILLTLAALATLSTASFAAGNRSYDLRDEQYYNTSGISGAETSSVIAEEAPFAVSGNGGVLSNFDRLNMNREKNELSSH